GTQLTRLRSWLFRQTRTRNVHLRGSMSKSQVWSPCRHTCWLLFRPLGLEGFSTTHSAAQSVAEVPPPGTQADVGAVLTRCRAAGSQAATWLQGVSAPHTRGVPTQTPAPQASPVVHGLRSSQAVPSGAAVWVQAPVGSQPSTVHGLESSQAAGEHAAMRGTLLRLGGRGPRPGGARHVPGSSMMWRGATPHAPHPHRPPPPA